MGTSVCPWLTVADLGIGRLGDKAALVRKVGQCRLTL
jgi:hypothetical protein